MNYFYDKLTHQLTNESRQPCFCECIGPDDYVHLYKIEDGIITFENLLRGQEFLDYRNLIG